jgi:hypothetical protein
LLIVEADRGVSTIVLSKPKTEPTPWIGNAFSEPVTTISSSFGTSAPEAACPQAADVIAVQDNSPAASMRKDPRKRNGRPSVSQDALTDRSLVIFEFIPRFAGRLALIL